jgi:hypothetical protein
MNLALWKYSFEVASKELELVIKKKQALDNLFNLSKISESTFNYLNNDLNDAITEAETHQKNLADRIAARATELENQLKSLELLLANSEIHYSAGEIGEELYTNQSNAITLGLEATQLELIDIKAALSNFISEVETPTTPSTPSETDYEEEEIAETVDVITDEPVTEEVDVFYEEPTDKIVESLTEESTEEMEEEATEGAVSEENSSSDETLAY